MKNRTLLTNEVGGLPIYPPLLKNVNRGVIPPIMIEMTGGPSPVQ